MITKRKSGRLEEAISYYKIQIENGKLLGLKEHHRTLTVLWYWYGYAIRYSYTLCTIEGI